MKRSPILIAYNVVVITTLFLALEIAVRLFVPQIKTQGTTMGLVADSLYYTTHGLRPLSSGTTNGASVAVNKYGFRKSTAEIDTSKTCWLLLGDSVTFGVGVGADSTFAGILQSRIGSVNILNPSTSGYNINSYRDVFRYLVLENRRNLTTRRVSIFWCLNDVYATVPSFEMPGGKVRYFLSDFLTLIRIHSRLYHFAKTLLFDRPQSYFLFDRTFYDVDSSEFQNAIKSILEINRLCQEREILFDLVLLPYEYQLREGDFSPQTLIKQALGDEVNVIDPFQKRPNRDFSSKFFFLYGDGVHFSSYGHRYIAEFILDYLANKGESKTFGRNDAKERAPLAALSLCKRMANDTMAILPSRVAIGLNKR